MLASLKGTDCLTRPSVLYASSALRVQQLELLGRLPVVESSNPTIEMAKECV
jgi:hypothetical protein